MNGSVVVGRRFIVVGGSTLSTYKLLLYLGCLLGIVAGSIVAADAGLDPDRFAWTVVGLLVPALVGARLWHLRDHAAREATRGVVSSPLEGGAALFGGLGLGVVASVPVLAILDMPFGSFWDAASITMLVGLIVTRVGCVCNGCCAGRVSAGRLAIRLPNVRGEWERRVPTQLLEAGLALVLLAGALALRTSSPAPGVLFVAVVALYSSGRAVVEAVREDSHAPRVIRDRPMQLMRAGCAATRSAEGPTSRTW